jgi:hypothetical protein
LKTDKYLSFCGKTQTFTNVHKPAQTLNFVQLHSKTFTNVYKQESGPPVPPYVCYSFNKWGRFLTSFGITTIKNTNMTTAAATTVISQQTSTLTLVKGKQEYDQQVKELTHVAWQISYSALWNGKEFSVAEMAAAKERIQSFIQNGSPLKTFSEYVQRVLLARQYIITHEGTYAPRPGHWLNPQNTKGFAGTQRWFTAVQEARAAEPAFKQYIKAFPEAVLEVLQSNKAADFHYWRSWFAERGAQATLNLFLSVLANCNYLR